MIRWLILVVVCLTLPILLTTLIGGYTKELAFTSDERSLLRHQVTARILQGTEASNISLYPGSINDHRVEVIKGTVVDSIDEYPYTVSLLNGDPDDGGWHMCGGTLIAMNIVLSAAHCRPHVKSARVGHRETEHQPQRSLHENDFEENQKFTFQSDIKDTVYQKRKIIALDDDSFVVHPKYDPGTGENDFMLIRLGENFDATPFPELNSNDNIPNAYGTDEDKKLLVLGWGMTIHGDGNSGSEKLLKADLSYLDNYRCGLSYGNAHIKVNMLCAHSDSGRDACNGDSGGPLVALHKELPENHLLVGVVSWGAACGSATYPGVYARVSSAYRWINEVTCTKLNPSVCENGLIRAFERGKITPSPSRKATNGPSNISDNPSASPTPLPASCKDFTGRFFITKKSDQIRNCAWVRSSKYKSTKWYRCRWFRFYCPRTCNSCTK